MVIPVIELDPEPDSEPDIRPSVVTSIDHHNNQTQTHSLNTVHSTIENPIFNTQHDVHNQQVPSAQPERDVLNQTHTSLGVGTGGEQNITSGLDLNPTLSNAAITDESTSTGNVTFTKSTASAPSSPTHNKPKRSRSSPSGANAEQTNNEKDLESQAPKRKPIQPTMGQSFKNTIKAVPILCAIPIMLPISWALHFSHQSPIAVFVTSLLGIVPLAGGLGFATEELAIRVGEAWGGLLNASFGNAVELLIAILALVKGEIDLVQASMVGSILSNILLVLGMSYFAGGLRFHEQIYAIAGAQMHISLLGISLLAIVLPAAYHYAYPSTMEVVSQTIRDGAEVPYGEELDNLLRMSRGLSFILLAVYGMFLCFQLYTHSYLFRIPRERQSHPLPGPTPHHQHVFPRPNWVASLADSSSDDDSTTGSSSSSIHSSNNGTTSGSRRLGRRFRRWSTNRHERRGSKETDTAGNAGTIPPRVLNDVQEHQRVSQSQTRSIDPGLEKPIRRTTGLLSIPIPAGLAKPNATAPVPPSEEDEEEIIGHEVPKVNFYFAIGMLCAMTALAGITAEWLLESIDGLTATGNVSREFVGLILLPVIGNSVEHVTAVTVSVKDKLNLSMSIAVGSSIQVSLCLLPILVLIGWAIGQPMILFFDTFETITLVIAVLLVNFAISDGRTNYLEGFVMMMAYLSIALVCWFYDPLV